MLYACVHVVVCRVLYAYVVLRPVHVLVCVMNNNMIHYTLVVAAVAATAGEGRDRRDRDGEEAETVLVETRSSTLHAHKRIENPPFERCSLQLCRLMSTLLRLGYSQ